MLENVKLEKDMNGKEKDQTVKRWRAVIES
jgi:hypothetical protein